MYLGLLAEWIDYGPRNCLQRSTHMCARFQLYVSWQSGTMDIHGMVPWVQRTFYALFQFIPTVVAVDSSTHVPRAFFRVSQVHTGISFHFYSPISHHLCCTCGRPGFSLCKPKSRTYSLSLEVPKKRNFLYIHTFTFKLIPAKRNSG